MKHRAPARLVEAPLAPPIGEAACDTPRTGEIVSEIAMILALHLAVALAVVSTLAALGLG
jgi:hypothetical protein